MSALEEHFALQVKAARLPEMIREYRFAKPRRWRFDFAYPEAKLAVEIEGGIWNGGRHTRGKGFEADAEKYNSAVLLGWKVLRFTGDMVGRGIALTMLEQALKENV